MIPKSAVRKLIKNLLKKHKDDTAIKSDLYYLNQQIELIDNELGDIRTFREARPTTAIGSEEGQVIGHLIRERNELVAGVKQIEREGIPLLYDETGHPLVAASRKIDPDDVPDNLKASDMYDVENLDYNNQNEIDRFDRWYAENEEAINAEIYERGSEDKAVAYHYELFPRDTSAWVNALWKENFDPAGVLEPKGMIAKGSKEFDREWEVLMGQRASSQRGARQIQKNKLIESRRLTEEERNILREELPKRRKSIYTDEEAERWIRATTADDIIKDYEAGEDIIFYTADDGLDTGMNASEIDEILGRKGRTKFALGTQAFSKLANLILQSANRRRGIVATGESSNDPLSNILDNNPDQFINWLKANDETVQGSADRLQIIHPEWTADSPELQDAVADFAVIRFEESLEQGAGIQSIDVRPHQGKTVLGPPSEQKDMLTDISKSLESDVFSVRNADEEGFVIVQRQSPVTGKMNSRKLEATIEQFARYNEGEDSIQNIFPNLNPDEREFIMTGVLDDAEWQQMVGPEDPEYFASGGYINGKRNKYQEGGEGILPPQPIPAAVEAAMPADDTIETERVDEAIFNAELTPDEEQYLDEKLTDDPMLESIIDKVLITAVEFQGEGPVEGPGTEMSDSIPARLSDGEFVINAEATRNIGPENLQRMMDDNSNVRRMANIGGYQDELDRLELPTKPTIGRDSSKIRFQKNPIDEEISKLMVRKGDYILTL